MRRLVDLRTERVSVPPPVHDVTAELAACLERFLDATADEAVLVRARSALDTWRTTRTVNDQPQPETTHSLRTLEPSERLGARAS